MATVWGQQLLGCEVDSRFYTTLSRESQKPRMTDQERLAIENAVQGDFTDLQLLLLDSCESLRTRMQSEIPHDMRQVLAVDDLIQEICVEAIRDIGSFEWRGDGSFHHWLNEIARTCLLDLVRTHRRKKRGGQHVGIRLSWLDVAELILHQQGNRSPVPTPSRVLHTREVANAVQRAVSQLPNHERVAMRLYYLQQLSTDAVAAELQITPGAVRAVLQRARKRLFKLLGPNAHQWLLSGD